MDLTAKTFSVINDEKLSALNRFLKKDKINSCIVNQNGKNLFEFYRNNKMKDKLHKVNSVTKSLVSILMGIAIEKKQIMGVDVPISNYFPNISEEKKQITIEHLLTMTPGFDWPEFSSWGGRPMPMINSKDWVKFVLDRKMEEEPGENMYYNSGCSHLLSAIIQIATGERLTDFADKYLFQPLGITEYDWYYDSKGIAIGGFGLSLKAEDMLKIGQLMLQKGMWNDKRIISEKWVEESTLPRYNTYKIGAYGYHWWNLTDEEKELYSPEAFFAMGYGGQYIIVVPKLDLVTIFTSDNYSDTFKALTYFRDRILA